MSIRTVRFGVAVAAVAGAATACAPGQKDMTDRASGDEPRALAVANTPRDGKRPVVLFVGTSLTAGYGLPSDRAYPALLEDSARAAGLPMTAVNAGVSGETSAGALNRIEWVLRRPADVVVLETGANDGLRALPVRVPRRNISRIIDKIREAKPGVPVVLVQMEAPRNLGARYYEPFHDMYGEIAKAKGVVLAPFLLEGVAGNPALNQGDGLHPNEAGAAVVAGNVWRALEPVVRSFQVGAGQSTPQLN